MESLETRTFLSTAVTPTSAGNSTAVASIRFLKPTTTVLTASANPSTYGQPLSLTASVTSLGLPVTDGTVTFDEGQTILATNVSVNASGNAIFSTSTLPASPAPETITASYTGPTQFATSTGSLQETINPAALTITGVSANNKVADGTPFAKLNDGAAALSGVLPGDTVTLNSSVAAGTFSDSSIGDAKPVTVTGFSISGPSASNYVLSQPTGITANIDSELSVMAIGDSITYGQGVLGGYRTELYQDLTTAGDPVQFVGSGTGNASYLLSSSGQAANDGVPYYTTADVLQNLNGPSTSTYGDAGNPGYWLSGPPGASAPLNPDVILLMIGTNDLLLDNETPQQAAAGLDAVVNAITTERPDTDLIISSIPFTGAAYNALIPGIVSKYAAMGRDVTFVDSSSALDPTTYLSADGVHPNAAGYQVLGDEWFGAISNLLPTPSPSTSIWSDSATPVASLQNLNDPNIATYGGVELGLKFTSSTNGYVTGVRFWKGAQGTGTQTGELWSSSGQELATATFTNETASGWQLVTFASPVAITANTTYVVSYNTTSPFVAYGIGTFSAAGLGNSQLHALGDGIDGGNGVYQYDTTPGVSSFPGLNNGQAPNYWVDVAFSATLPVASTAPTNPISVFPESTAPIPSLQNINDPTISADGGVELGVKFQSSVAGQVTGVRFYKGDLATGTQTGELWSSDGTLLATAAFTTETASGWQAVTFSTPVSIAANTTYIVSYHTTSPYLAYTPYMLASSGIYSGSLQLLADGVDGNNGVYHYDTTPGVSSFPNLYNGQAPNYWVDVVFSADAEGSSGSGVTPPAGPATLFSSNSAPAASLQNLDDPNITAAGGVELGMEFTSDVSGFVTGVRFWKGSLDTGTQTGELWTANGMLLATAAFTNESASGWQEANFSSPVAISANTVYIISYHTTSPYIAYGPNAFATTGINNGVLHAPANGVDGYNGVYEYGASSTFPDLYNGQAPNYWVDVVFTTST